jgi:hypothetical protein
MVHDRHSHPPRGRVSLFVPPNGSALRLSPGVMTTQPKGA